MSSSRQRGVLDLNPDAIREAREAAGLTQEQVAEALGWDKAARTGYSRVELGLKSLSPPLFVKLAAAFGVAPADLTDTPPDQVTLRHLREWAGHTRATLAAEMGVSAPLIEKWERGASQPKGERLDELAHALGVAHSDLSAATGE